MSNVKLFDPEKIADKRLTEQLANVFKQIEDAKKALARNMGHRYIVDKEKSGDGR